MVGGAIFLVLVAASVFERNMRPRPPTATTVPPLPPTAAAATRPMAAARRVPAGPVLAITAAEVMRAYDENEIAADQKLKGRRWRVQGEIVSIHRTITETPFVALHGYDRAGLRRVQFEFPFAAEPQLAALKPGQIIRIDATCRGLWGNVRFDECQIADVTDRLSPTEHRP